MIVAWGDKIPQAGEDVQVGGIAGHVVAGDMFDVHEALGHGGEGGVQIVGLSEEVFNVVEDTFGGECQTLLYLIFCMVGDKGSKRLEYSDYFC